LSKVEQQADRNVGCPQIVYQPALVLCGDAVSGLYLYDDFALDDNVCVVLPHREAVVKNIDALLSLTLEAIFTQFV